MLLPVVSGNAEDTSDSETSAMDIQSLEPGPSAASQILTHAPSRSTPQEPQFTVQIPQSLFTVRVSQRASTIQWTTGQPPAPILPTPNPPAPNPPTPDLPTSNPPKRQATQMLRWLILIPIQQPHNLEVTYHYRKRHAVSSQPIFNQDQESGKDKLMHTLYNGIRTSNAEVVNKQDVKINKLTNSVQQNSTILDYLLEALDIQSVKSKDKQRQQDMDIDREERHQGDSDTTGTMNAKNKPDGNHTDADDPGDSTQETPFSYASKKKGSPCSGAVKHRPQQELKNKETIRQWFNEVMEGKDLYKNEVSNEEAKKFAEKFKLDLLVRPCTVDNFRYWIAGVPKSAWNKGASYVLIDIPVKKRLITKPDIKARDALREAFFVQLKMLHGIWLEKQKMLEDKNLPHAVFAKRWQRKNTLLINVDMRPLQSCSNKKELLEPYLEDFDELGVVKMSSNKEEPDMDSKYVLQHQGAMLAKPTAQELGPQFGFTRGAAPRLCMDNNDKSSKSRYVVGLPAHFYNAEWLEKQEPGWAKGGTGFVNELVHPCAPRKLVFPADLA
ncbi:hypothetical protein F5051DRAFT_434431, partial [Lentinula edodes]